MSSIGVSWQVFNSVFTDNTAIGFGSKPATAGHAGRRQRGGDLSRRQPFHARPRGQHHSRQHGQRRRWCDLLRLEQPHRRTADHASVLERNPSLGFETAGFPGIFFLGLGAPQVTTRRSADGLSSLTGEELQCRAGLGLLLARQVDTLVDEMGTCRRRNLEGVGRLAFRRQLEDPRPIGIEPQLRHHRLVEVLGLELQLEDRDRPQWCQVVE